MEKVNWEKVSVYLAVFAGILTTIFYIADIKERMASVEVEVRHLKEKK